MEKNSKKSQKPSASEKKPKQQQKNPEAVEPHELAGMMTDEQLDQFVAELKRMMDE